jgi:hypothetical protein
LKITEFAQNFVLPAYFHDKSDVPVLAKKSIGLHFEPFFKISSDYLVTVIFLTQSINLTLGEKKSFILLFIFLLTLSMTFLKAYKYLIFTNNKQQTHRIHTL